MTSSSFIRIVAFWLILTIVHGAPTTEVPKNDTSIEAKVIDPTIASEVSSDVNRKKKSATTTLCIEVRPSDPYHRPFQICEPSDSKPYPPAPTSPHTYGTPSKPYAAAATSSSSSASASKPYAAHSGSTYNSVSYRSDDGDEDEDLDETEIEHVAQLMRSAVDYGYGSYMEPAKAHYKKGHNSLVITCQPSLAGYAATAPHPPYGNYRSASYPPKSYNYAPPAYKVPTYPAYKPAYKPPAYKPPSYNYKPPVYKPTYSPPAYKPAYKPAPYYPPPPAYKPEPYYPPPPSYAAPPPAYKPEPAYQPQAYSEPQYQPPKPTYTPPPTYRAAMEPPAHPEHHQIPSQLDKEKHTIEKMTSIADARPGAKMAIPGWNLNENGEKMPVNWGVDGGKNVNVKMPNPRWGINEDAKSAASWNVNGEPKMANPNWPIASDTKEEGAVKMASPSWPSEGKDDAIEDKQNIADNGV